MSVYSDLDFKLNRFERNDLQKLEDTSAINQSIKNILLTNKGEVPFEPLFGSKINGLLFEPMSPVTDIMLKNEIKFALKNFEPRIRINSINIDKDYDNKSYDIYIIYEVVKLNTIGEVNLSLNIQGI